jgi:hypothetical protein
MHKGKQMLDPYFVSGFSDAEASFIILILKEQKKPKFSY